MRRISKFLSGLVICFLALCVLPIHAYALTDDEPNDSFAAAQNLTPGDTIEGSISENGDLDFYKVTLPSSGRISLDMTSYMQYYTLQVYDPSGNELWVDDANDWNVFVGFRNDAYNLDLLAGTYYIKVTGCRYADNTRYQATGTYTMKTSFTSADTNETESNNSLAEADSMGFNSTIHGQIAVNDTYDFYQVKLSRSGRISLDMTSYMQYYTLQLFDPSGKELWGANNNEWNASVGFRNDIHNLDLIPGTYYLKVTGYLSSNSTTYASTGTYALTASYTAAKTSESEKNNSPVDADSVGLYDTINGQIAINDPYDFYCFTLPQNRTVKLDITSYMQYYTLQIYDLNGNEVWYDEYNEWISTAGYTTETFKVDLTAGTYYLKVTGYRFRNDASLSSTGTYKIVLNHQTFTNLSIANSAASGKIKLSWDPIDGATKYQIYRATSENGTYTKIKTTTATSYTDSSAKVGKTYYYKIKVLDASNTKFVTSPVLKRVCDLPRPAVTDTNTASTGKTKLSWDAIDGAEEYVIYRATAKDGKYSKVATTAKTSYTDSSAKVGTTYYYKVVAVHKKTSANSASSKVVSATRDLPRPTVSVTVKSNGDPKVSWKEVSGAAQYYVYRAASKDGKYTKVTSTTKLSFTDTTAEAGKTYYYKVKAIHSASAANSAYSAVVKAKAK